MVFTVPTLKVKTRTFLSNENWQLTFVDSAYSKYESKIKFPLLQKLHSYLFSKPLSQHFVLTMHVFEVMVIAGKGLGCLSC